MLLRVVFLTAGLLACAGTLQAGQDDGTSACPETLVRDAEPLEDTALDMGAPYALVHRLRASDRWEAASPSIRLYRWLSAAHRQFFERLAIGLALPQYASRPEALDVRRGTLFGESLAKARARLLTDVLSQLGWRLEPALHQRVTSVLVEYPEVTAARRIDWDRLETALRLAVRTQLRESDKPAIVEWLERTGSTGGMRGRELRRALTPAYLYELFHPYVSRFRAEYTEALSDPDTTVAALLEGSGEEFLQRQGVPPGSFRALTRRVLDLVFADAPPAAKLAGELKDVLLAFCVRQLRADLAALPPEAPKPRRSHEPGYSPVPRFEAEPPAEEPSRGPKVKTRPTVPVPVVVSAPVVSVVEESFESLVLARKLSDLHHAQFWAWFTDAPDDMRDFVEAAFRHIFGSKPAQWRHTRPLRQGLHELKVPGTIVRIYFWIGPGGLRIVEACDDPKSNTDYEQGDYAELRRQIRALTRQ